MKKRTKRFLGTLAIKYKEFQDVIDGVTRKEFEKSELMEDN